MSTTRAAWLFTGLLTAVRLSILPTTDLEFDEAHYWLWSQHLAPAYFSKGPAIAFVIRASTALFGSNEFGVRFFSPILAAGTSLLLFYFARRLFSAAAALWSVLALNVTPLFNVGAFLMTIDPLSIFFWLAAMFSFWIAVEKSPSWSWHWPLTGLLVGLGFLSKYTNALELVSIILVLALVPRLRHEFARPRLYLLLTAFAVCTIPPIVWNAQHVWITLTHLKARGSLEQGFGIHPLEVLAFVGEHFLAYSPLLFLGLAWGVLGSCRRIGQQLKVLFLFWFGLPVFAFYFLLSFNKVAAPNWDALAMLGFGLLAVHFWRERIAGHVSLRVVAAAALVVGLMMSALTLDTDMIRSLGLEFWRSDPSNRMRGWKSATLAVENIRNDIESKLGERLFLIADARDRASEISFYLRDKKLEAPGHPPVYIVEAQDIQNQFSFWPRYDEFVEAKPGAPRSDEEAATEGSAVNPFVGRNALFVREGFGERLPHNIRAGFQSVAPVAVIEVWRYGRLLRRWQLFLCRAYRTLPL
ncbi:MAG TPA: glycosyltransferase family 39 protein [Chthoniobacterales bacterium]|nr:glycosyltransferase family 39 protein [Chthoniobacterales bacterium]